MGLLFTVFLHVAFRQTMVLIFSQFPMRGIVIQ